MKISLLLSVASFAAAGVVVFLACNGGPLDGGVVPAQMAVGGGILPLPGEHLMKPLGGVLLTLFILLGILNGARTIARD